MTKTDWFDGSKFVPAHVGLYERKWLSSAYSLSYWNGEKWYSVVIRCDRGIPNYTVELDNLDWRGLKEQA